MRPRLAFTTATDPDGALRPLSGGAHRPVCVAARLRRCVPHALAFHTAPGRCGSAPLVIRTAPTSHTICMRRPVCGGRQAWGAEQASLPGQGFRKPRGTAAGGATTRALRPCAMALPLLPSDCARLRRLRRTSSFTDHQGVRGSLARRLPLVVRLSRYHGPGLLHGLL